MHILELFFRLSYTLPLHDSHLNTGFLNAELQANWHGIKPTKWLIKFILTTTICFVGFNSVPNLIVILFNLLYHVFIVGFNCKGCMCEKEKVCEDSSKLKTEEFSWVARD